MTVSVQSVLDDWGVEKHGVELCSAQTLSIQLESHTFQSARIWCDTPPGFDDTCCILLPVGAVEVANKITIRRLSAAALRNLTIVILKPTNFLALFFGASNARVFVGNFGYEFRAQVNLWRSPLICIGDQATSNGITAIVDDADVMIGRDSMLSSDILLQSHAQHGVIDVASKRIVNTGRHHIHVGGHAWIGRRAMLMPNVSVGAGSIVSTGAIVTKDVPPLSMAAGIPATVMRSGVTWCREPGVIDAETMERLEQ